MSISKQPIPSSWAWTTLGQCFRWASGGTPSRSRSDFFGGDIPWVIITDMDDRVLTVTSESISEAGLDGSSAKWVDEGAVLVALYGSIGKLAIAGISLTTNQAIASTNPKPHDNRYLFYYLLSRRTELIGLGKGGTQSNINLGVLKAVSFPVAPLAEQSRIADRIDELLTDLAAGVAALERVKRNLSRYRAAVLHAAVTGRLTEAWRKEHGPPEEPAPKLLERILAERRKQWERRTLAAYEAKGTQPPKNWKSRYKEPVPPKLPKGATTLPELPDGWCWASNDQLIGIITSGSRDWSPFYGSGTGTFIMAQNIRMGYLDRSYRQAVNPPKNHRDRKRSQVEEHDLLVTIVGANTGDVCRVPEPLPEHYVCQSVALMRPVVGPCSHWLEVWFTALTGAQRQFKEFIYGAGRPHLGFEHLEQTLVALPPLDEQSAVIEAATEKLSQIDALEAEVTRGLGRAGRLRQAILKAAFEGKLVPQDPTDEPAMVLLERIRDQAAEAPKSRRSTKKKTTRKAAIL